MLEYTQGDVTVALVARLREINRLDLGRAVHLDLVQQAHAMADELRDRLRAEQRQLFESLWVVPGEM